MVSISTDERQQQNIAHTRTAQQNRRGFASTSTRCLLCVCFLFWRGIRQLLVSQPALMRARVCVCGCVVCWLVCVRISPRFSMAWSRRAVAFICPLRCKYVSHVHEPPSSLLSLSSLNFVLCVWWLRACRGSSSRKCKGTRVQTNAYTHVNHKWAKIHNRQPHYSTHS